MSTRKVKKVMNITIEEFVRMMNNLKANERLYFCESLDESDNEGIGWHSVTRLDNENECILLIRYQGRTDTAMCLYGEALKSDIKDYLASNDFPDENRIYVELEVEEVKKYAWVAMSNNKGYSNYSPEVFDNEESCYNDMRNHVFEKIKKNTDIYSFYEIESIGYGISFRRDKIVFKDYGDYTCAYIIVEVSDGYNPDEFMEDAYKCAVEMDKCL